MTDYAAAERGVVTSLLVAATTGTGNPLVIPVSFRHHCFIVQGDGAVGAGAITLEAASAPDYAGTWAALTTAVTVVSTAQVIYQYVGVLPVVRARVTTTVTTTSATVLYYGGP